MTPREANELNEQVARKLGIDPETFKYVCNGQECTAIPNYVGDIVAAWKIVEFVGKNIYPIVIQYQPNYKTYLVRIGFYSYEEAETAPEAICRAFLKLK